MASSSRSKDRGSTLKCSAGRQSGFFFSKSCGGGGRSRSAGSSSTSTSARSTYTNGGGMQVERLVSDLSEAAGSKTSSARVEDDAMVNVVMADDVSLSVGNLRWIWAAEMGDWVAFGSRREAEFGPTLDCSVAIANSR